MEERKRQKMNSKQKQGKYIGLMGLKQKQAVKFMNVT